MKFIRWSYVAPRLLIVGLAVTSLWWGLDPALQWALTAGGQSAVGAKVELAELETSILNAQIAARGLQIANPDSPMRNLVECEEALLQVDSRELLNQRLRIRDGRLVGIRLDTPRESSGALPDAEANEQTDALAPDPMVEALGDLAATWLDDANARLTRDFTDELQTPLVARELEAQWKEQAASLRRRAKALQKQTASMKGQLDEIRKNPLRGIEKLPALRAELESMQRDLGSLEGEIRALPQQARQDREALNVARRQDEAFLREQLQFATLDGEGLTQVILGKPVAERLRSTLQWISWGRSKLPKNPAKATAARRGRGTTVHFAPAKPRLLVERLHLELLGSVVGGAPARFTGTLTGLTTEPHLHAEPLRLELVSAGQSPMRVELVVDRRTESDTDHLHIACPHLMLAEHTIGNPAKLALQIGRSTATLDADIRLTGDALSGEVRYHQEGTRLTPVTDRTDREVIMAALRQALESVDSVEAEIALSGTLQRPSIKVTSGVGEQVAAGIGRAVKDLAAERTEALVAGVERQVDAQLADLATARAKFEEELLASLGENQQLLEQVAAAGKAAAPGSKTPRLGEAWPSRLLRK